jgi:hypothetical protein
LKNNRITISPAHRISPGGGAGRGETHLSEKGLNLVYRNKQFNNAQNISFPQIKIEKCNIMAYFEHILHEPELYLMPPAQT